MIKCRHNLHVNKDSFFKQAIFYGNVHLDVINKDFVNLFEEGLIESNFSLIEISHIYSRLKFSCILSFCIFTYTAMVNCFCVKLCYKCVQSKYF